MSRQDLDSALMADPAARFGAELGAFSIPFIAGYLLLRAANHPNRKPLTALILRTLAVLLTAFFAYAGYVGGGRAYLPLGGCVAVLVIMVWATIGALRGRSKPVA